MTRLIFPKNRLAKLLREAGGLPVAEAIERAGENLKMLGPQCQAEVEAVLNEIEACFARFPANRDGAALSELYAITSKAIGTASVAGLDGFDAALLSLCNLLDHLRTHGRWDRDAIGVHVQALRLLVHVVGPARAESRVVLAGLVKVTQRYAPPEAKAAV